MTQTRKKVWIDRIERWAASGLGVDAFAKSEGLNRHTLKNWKWKLGTQAREQRAGASTLIKPNACVEITASSREQMLAGPFEVSLRCGARIVVPAHFETGALRELICALEGR